MILFRKSKKRKAEKLLEEDVQFVIPSAVHFMARYKSEVCRAAARVDAEKILKVDEKTRWDYLIHQMDRIILEAMIETLIEAGYKREDKKKWKMNKMNWF